MSRAWTWPAGVVLVLAASWPVLRNVVLAGLRSQITSHTLITLGVIAALAAAAQSLPDLGNSSRLSRQK